MKKRTRTKLVPYGQECILDVHNCVRFSRKSIRKFCEQLCRLLEMTPEDLHFWDYQDNPKAYKRAPAHLKGTSAVQFIQTSNITIHALDELKRLYLNIFSCKPFSADLVRLFVEKWSGGTIVNLTTITRI